MDLIRSMSTVWPQLAGYERMAWFLYGCCEREQRLNLEALWWTLPCPALALFWGTPTHLFLSASMSAFAPARD
jgi:hypothetical protein